MANSNNWGEIYKSTWWGDKAWSANTLFIDSAPPGFGLNLLKASEDMDNTRDWLRKTGATVSGDNTNDPNGELTAERVDFVADQYSRIQQLVTLEASTTYTFSVHARVPSGQPSQDFRLRVFGVSGATGSFTALSSGWTRFDFDFITTTAGTHTLAIMNDADGADRSIQFWGAMLNEGADVGGYVKTDASVGGSSPSAEYTGFGDEFAGVTAYYSLRQFTEAETLNAIRVRRSSDDTEQDIGFDSNGDLDTTALLAFVNEDVTKADTDFSTDTSGTSESGLDMLANQSIGGRSGVLKATIQATTEQHRLIVIAVDPGNKTHRLQTSIYIPSGQSGQTVDGFRIENTGLEVYPTTTTKDAWVDIDVTWSSSTNQFLFIKFLPSGGAESWTGNGTDEVYIGDVTITQTTADGAVTTFYDQSGNGNDATNSTESEQPLVVSAGSVVTENGKVAIDFDGVDDNFRTTLSQGGTYTAFVVHTVEDTSFPIIIGSEDLSKRILIVNNSTKQYYQYFAPTQTLSSPSNSVTFGQQALVSVLKDTSATDAFIYKDGTLLDGISSTTADNSANFQIGAEGGDTLSFPYEGTQQELILFASDQSTNRTGMETNINDHFDIYTP